MNNNMYNQPTGTNNVAQTPVQPQGMNNVAQTPVQPQGQPAYNGQPNTPSAGGAAMNNLKNTISNIDKDSAKKYIGMGAGALMLLSVFLPYISVSIYGYTSKASIWDSDATLFKILLIVLSLIPIATFFFQKAKSLSYLSAGYAFSFAIWVYDSTEGFSGLSFGFWFLLLASIALIVLCVMDDLAEIKSMFSSKVKANTGLPVANANTTMVPPAASAQPVAPAATNPMQPVVQNVEVCNFCGQPKRNATDVTCPSCGQRY